MRYIRTSALAWRARLGLRHSHGADGVEDRQYQHADIPENRKFHAGKSQGAENHYCYLHENGEDNVLLDDPHRLARDPHGLSDFRKVVIHQDYVGGFDCGGRTQRTHGDAHIGAGQYRGVVDAVTDESYVAGSVQKALELFDLVGGKKTCEIIIDSNLRCHLGRDLFVVAGEHHDVPDACLAKACDRLLRIGLKLVVDNDMAEVFTPGRSRRRLRGQFFWSGRS